VSEPTRNAEPVPDAARPRTSTRAPEALRAALEPWLARRTGDAGARISDVRSPETNGMSSETLLFDARWTAPDGHERFSQCVARLAPASDAMPIFPEYRMRDQFTVMALVGERTAVPVPRTLWYESDPEILGTEFFVMERVEGLVQEAGMGLRRADVVGR
jgi:aminoglycoside phosphotransferase (APT) family kinase protein